MNKGQSSEVPNYKIVYSEKGKYKTKQMATEYLRTILYWTILGAGFGSFITWYADKNFIKYRVLQNNRKSVKVGLFFLVWAGCLFRGKYFADWKFKIGQKELFEDDSNFEKIE